MFMKNKRRYYVVLSLVLLFVLGCKNKDIDIETLKIDYEKVTPTATSVSINGSYSFSGNVNGMKIIIGLKESLIDATIHNMQLEGTDFYVTIEDLIPDTTYYYRYSIDVGGSNPHLMETKNFKTENGQPSNPININVTANPTTIPYGSSSRLMAIASGGDGNYTYTWSPALFLDNANLQSPRATPTVTTTYTCTVTNDGYTATASCKVIVVNAPTNLTATVQNDNSVYLCWTSADPAQSYKVYRDDTLIAQNISMTAYTDNDLRPGTYTYQVATFYDSVESPKSDAAMASIAFQVPEGALNGLFSINPTKQVWFSKGNLQYQSSSSTWRFATKQYDCIRESNVSIFQHTDGWIDLFGWGTSGYDHGAICFQPCDYNQTSSYYYAYGDHANNLYDKTGQADWGYNAISNGGNMEKQWRTLTEDEWRFLLFDRITSSMIRYAKAILNDVEGMVVLPDNWDASIYSLNETNNVSANYSANIINENDWMNVFETNGAVFLPAGSYRRGSDYIEYSNPYKAYYWTSSSFNESQSKYVEFNNTQLFVGNRDRAHGLSVRLVRNLE